MQQRIEAVRNRVDIADVIGRVVKLGRGAKPRGKCPFHGSKSDSLAVDPNNGRARCWGCRVDPEAPGIAFARTGPVTALIDADMSPLRGPRDPRTGAFRGVPVIDRRRGPIVRREITPVERSALCSALVTQSWRAVGCRVSAFRPRMGQDFNDALREIAA